MNLSSFAASSTEAPAVQRRAAGEVPYMRDCNSSGAASSGDQFQVGSSNPEPESMAWSKHQDVWSNVEKVAALMPRLVKNYRFDVEGDVGDDDDTPDDPLCLWCSAPNVGMLPYCSNCKRWTGGCPDLDAMRARFTAGAPDDQIDEPNAPVIGQTDVDHAPIEPERPNSTAPYSELDLSEMIHWRDGVINHDTNKHLFKNAVEHIGWQKLEAMKAKRMSADYVVQEWA